MSKLLDIKTLEIDVSNKCGNTCQGCYHNKVITDYSTSPTDFDVYLQRFFSFNQRKKIESLALYGGNILENKNFLSYLEILGNYDSQIESYLFSTTFGEYNTLAQTHQKFLLSNFFKDKKFIFQYFFNSDFVNEYITSCKDLLSFGYTTYVFFSIQLVSLEKEHVLQVLKSLQKFFIGIGYFDAEIFHRIEQNIIQSIKSTNRTENLKITIGTYTFLIMVLSPVRKEKNIITSVCGTSCSFYSSSSIQNDTYTSSMLSIEYNGDINFHNPNCIASMQRICNIQDSSECIELQLKEFHSFLGENIKSSSSLLESCNNCLKHNLSPRKHESKTA